MTKWFIWVGNKFVAGIEADEKPQVYKAAQILQTANKGKRGDEE